MNSREEIIERVDIGYVVRGEIVRCRDCWHWDKTPHTYCNFHDIKSVETDYCSWGEHREDGEA